MTLRVSRDWGVTWRSTVVYPNSSWYSGLAVVKEGVATRRVLLAFAKDCNESLRYDDRDGDGWLRSAAKEGAMKGGVMSGVTVECAGINLWTHTLN